MEWKVTRQEGYHGNRTQYNVEDIDYFAFYCLETDTVCLVPFDENFPTSCLTIRLDNYTGNRLSTMRFAKDYQISNFVST